MSFALVGKDFLQSIGARICFRQHLFDAFPIGLHSLFLEMFPKGGGRGNGHYKLEFMTQPFVIPTGSTANMWRKLGMCEVHVNHLLRGVELDSLAKQFDCHLFESFESDISKPPRAGILGAFGNDSSHHSRSRKDTSFRSSALSPQACALLSRHQHVVEAQP